MASKVFELDDGLAVTVYKRRGNRNLRLSISASAEVRVSIPAWAPYKAGVDFARSRQQWITEQLKLPQLLIHGQVIGKAHHLFFETAEVTAPKTRVDGTTIIVRYPPDMQVHNAQVQQAAQTASVRALRHQSESLLPQRLAHLATQHDFTYRSVTIKRLKGRWGSCDQHQNIVLNLFLMQLPWDLIDYVLLHELTHTKILRHGPDFWTAMEAVLPGAKLFRKRMRAHQPILG